MEKFDGPITDVIKKNTNEKENYVLEVITKKFGSYDGFVAYVMKKMEQVKKERHGMDLRSDDFVGFVLEDCPPEIGENAFNILRCSILDIVGVEKSTNGNDGCIPTEKNSKYHIEEKILKGAKAKADFDSLKRGWLGVDNDIE